MESIVTNKTICMKKRRGKKYRGKKERGRETILFFIWNFKRKAQIVGCLDRYKS